MSRVSRALRSELIYAAAAANAWLRGLSIPDVALHYRYEPVTALHLIRRCVDEYGEVNVQLWVPDPVLGVCRSVEPVSLGSVKPPLRRRAERVPTLAAGSGEDSEEKETL